MFAAATDGDGFAAGMHVQGKFDLVVLAVERGPVPEEHRLDDREGRTAFRYGVVLALPAKLLRLGKGRFLASHLGGPPSPNATDRSAEGGPTEMGPS